jgi:hypothetical protein
MRDGTPEEPIRTGRPSCPLNSADEVRERLEIDEVEDASTS